MIETGTVVNGRYEVRNMIGKGGTSHVYIVADKHIGRLLAMKVMDRDCVGAARFAKSEIESLRCVSYPLFPAIHDAFCDDGNIYIVSDYVRGTSLSSMCRGRGLPRISCLAVAQRICEALVYLHNMKRPMLYLDLKPDNIIISDDGLPHLIDFGIAGWLASKHIPVGTPGYSPPEQHDPQAVMDVRADIYAFGMTYYHMRHGVPPDADPEKALNAIRHSAILRASERSLLIKCCSPGKEDRYSSASDVLKQINHIRSIPYKLKKRIVLGAVSVGLFIVLMFPAKSIYNRLTQNESAARLAETAAVYMKDGEYTPEGIGIIKACINSGNLSEECEQEFIFEVAVNSMLIMKDYGTAAAYFSRLDPDRYPEASDYIRLCRIESRFDFDPQEALDVTGVLFSDIAKRSPSKMKYENLIFIAGCYENYDTDRQEGIRKALTVLDIAGQELEEVRINGSDRLSGDEIDSLKGRVDELKTVKRQKLNTIKKKDRSRHI